MLIINKVSEQFSNLTKSHIEGVFYLILNEQINTSKDIIQKTALPRETVTQVLTKMQPLLEPGDKIRFKNEHIAVIKQENPKPFDFESFQLTNFDEKMPASVLENFEREAKTIRSAAKREYDQFFATPLSSVKKAFTLAHTGLLESRHISVLGDDDLVSVAISLMDIKPAKVTVLEIDETLVTNLNAYFKSKSLNNFHAYKYDVLTELPQQFKRGFDVVITDPPYTRRGVTLFLNRAIELLDPKHYHNSVIHFYYGNSFKSREKWLKIQEVIGKTGLLIKNKVENFIHYNSAESIGSASSLYILLPNTATAPIEELIDSNNLYTFQEHGEEKFPYVDHIVIKATGISDKILNSKSHMQKLLGDFCKTHKLNVIDQKVTKFKKGGLSFTYILANSNLVVHTWPELGAVHIDLITCQPIYKKEALLPTIAKLFLTNAVEVMKIE